MPENKSAVQEPGSYTEYRTSTEVLTRRGGIFWGIVFLIIGIIWLLGTVGYIKVDVNIILPLLVIILGLWLIVTKLAR